MSSMSPEGPPRSVKSEAARGCAPAQTQREEGATGDDDNGGGGGVSTRQQAATTAEAR